jgi:sporulation protein YlmC with PRC-barrel domain
MYKLHSMKYAAVLVPALALGMPLAHAIGSALDGQSAEQRTTTTSPDRPATSTAGSQTSGAHQGFLASMPMRGYHSDSLVGKDVMNRRNNENVGQVSDLVLDEDGQVVAVIISVGGLLGIGARDVAIEWDQIERRVDGDDIALSVDFPEDRLENAPDYDSDRSDRRTGMTGTDRDNQRAGQTGDQRPGQRVGQDTEQRPGQRVGQGTEQHADQRATAGRTEYVETMPARGFHSDSLIGQNVKSSHNNETIGEISNLVLDSDGQVVAAIISVGGLLGIGARDVAISWDQIERRTAGDDTTLWVNLTEQSLKDAPKYSTDRTTSRRNR